MGPIGYLIIYGVQRTLNAGSAEEIMLLATGVSVAFAGLIAILIMPVRARLILISILAVPQFILPGLFESASMFQIWVAVSALLMLLQKDAVFPSLYGKILVSLAGLSVLVCLWSPLVNAALISTVQVLSLYSIALHVVYVVRFDKNALKTTFTWLSFGVIVEAAMTIGFRLNTQLELAFLESRAAELLIGSNKISNFFGGSPDNVFSPAKAGGLWLNANTASMFLGVAACAFAAAALRYRSK